MEYNEAKKTLEDLGIDPVEVGKTGEKIVSKIILEMKTEEQIRARLEHEYSARSAAMEAFVKSLEAEDSQHYQMMALHHHSIANVLEWVLNQKD